MCIESKLFSVTAGEYCSQASYYGILAEEYGVDIVITRRGKPCYVIIGYRNYCKRSLVQSLPTVNDLLLNKNIS